MVGHRPRSVHHRQRRGQRHRSGGGREIPRRRLGLRLLRLPGAKKIRMDRIRTADRVIASWINPITGERARIGEYPYAKPVTFSTPQGWDDALLLLEG